VPDDVRRKLGRLGLLALLGFCGACSGWGKDCHESTVYETDRQGSGTLVYGDPPISVPYGGELGWSVLPCMQAGVACTKVTMGAGAADYPGGGPFRMEVSIVNLRNGGTVALPSSDVAVKAFVDRLYSNEPGDGGARTEYLTVISGLIRVTVWQDNLEADYSMVFSRPSGGQVELRDVHAAELNGKYKKEEICY
jgi:hypothetical protein